jgi:hypothetical protein
MTAKTKKVYLLSTVALLSILVTVSLFATGSLAFSQSGATCDQSLWQHVYHGTFATAKDRLRPLEACKTVTGTLHFVQVEKDGDTHLRLDVDPQFKNLLNEKNANEKNMLVVESMCDKTPTQPDTVAESVCNGWHQHAYKSSMDGKHVSVTGAYVEDEEEDHGWREIHPVTLIEVK